MMTVLVTGATGFLGGYVVDEFMTNGYRVIAAGRDQKKLRALKTKGVQTFRGDLSSLSKITEPIDIVVHAAARSTVWGSWKVFYSDNVLGTQSVVDFCRRKKIKRLVFVSSPSVYSSAGDRLHITESAVDPHNRLNNYIRSKIAAERVVRDASTEIKTVILRPRGIIGVGDTSIVPRLLAANASFGIPLFNGGSNIVDLTCVENVALACRLAAESPNAVGKTYNITNGEPRKFKDIVRQLFDGLGVEPRFRYRNVRVVYGVAMIVEGMYRLLRIKAEPPITRYTVCTLGYSQTLNISRAKRDLGYKPKIGLDKGIQQYVAANKT